MRVEERELYRLHGRLPVHRRRVEAAIAVVRKALLAYPGSWAVCCSGGKDSTAMLSVAAEAGWSGPVFHFWHPETPPENTALVAGLAGRWGMPLRTCAVPGAWDAFEAAGFFVHATTAEQRDARGRMLRGYVAAAAAATADLAGLMMGLRAEESSPRAITVARRGTLYRTRDRAGATALPLARWSARDVWARHVACDLPWLLRYDRAEDREQQRSETTWLAAEGLWRHGQGAEMRLRDPLLWARLIDRWPELSRWG